MEEVFIRSDTVNTYLRLSKTNVTRLIEFAKELESLKTNIDADQLEKFEVRPPE